MNHRLRKKLHHGKYDYLGFLVDATYGETLPMEAVEPFADRIIERIESLGLTCAGGFNREGFGLFIERHREGSRMRNGMRRWHDSDATEADRQAMIQWASEPEQLRFKIQVGPLIGGFRGRKP